MTTDEIRTAYAAEREAAMTAHGVSSEAFDARAKKVLDRSSTFNPELRPPNAGEWLEAARDVARSLRFEESTKPKPLAKPKKRYRIEVLPKRRR